MSEIDENAEARRVLCEIRDLALSLYPFPKGCGVDDRYAAAFGLITGIVTDSITSVHDGRPFYVLGTKIKFGDKE